MSLHGSAVEALRAWAAPDSGQDTLRHAVLAFLDARSDACERACVPGHITASALVLDHTGETALLTLHPVLSPRGVRIEPVAVPPHWWTSSATPALRAHLERSVPAVEDDAAVRVVERSDRR